MDNTLNSANTIESQPEKQSAQKTPNDDMSLWLKMLIRVISVIAGIAGIVLGVIAAISTSGYCIIGGIILIVSGVLVLAFEVPIFCSCVKFIEPLSRFSSNRPHWQKIIMYVIPPIVIISLCQGVSSIIGSLSIFAVALIYFYLTFRRR